MAKQMDDNRISIAQAIHDQKEIYTADKIGIVCPVFGHEMPELVKEFLRVSRFETDYFYILLTYGNRHGGAAELAKEYVESLGIHPAYINVILMVDNFLPGFDMEGQKSVWNSEGCISCMACIHSCPMMAIRLKMPEKNPHARYRNENISLCEIVEANNQWGNERLE